MNPSFEILRKRKEVSSQMEPLENISGINIEPMALFKKLDSKKVINNLEIFSNQFLQNPDEFKKNTAEVFEKISQNKTEEIDPHKFLAILFLASRSRWPEVDLHKEQKTIQAVCEMLVGNHVNLTQGDGKTTAVIPVYSVARAILSRTSSQPAVVVSTSDSTKLEELQQEIRSFKNNFVNLIEPGQQRDKIEEKIVECQIPDTYADSVLSQKPVDVLRFAKVNGIKILLLTHQQLIFESEKHSDQWGKLPPMVVDEVHLLDRATFYTSRASEIKGSVEFANAEISNYFFARLISSEFENNQDFLKYVVFTEKSPELNTEGKDFLERLGKQINLLLTDQPNNLEILIKQVAAETKTPVEKIKEIVKRDWDSLNSKRNRHGTAKETDADYVGDQQSLLQDLFMEFSSVKMNLHEGGEFYDRDQTFVRDSLRGLALPSHKFDFKTRFWLSVINKKIVPFDDEMIDHYFHFSSWLAAVVKGRMIGLSGSLYEQNLKGDMVKSHLARTFEGFSQGLVTNLSPEQKPLPIPYIKIRESEEGLINSIREHSFGYLHSKKPHLIVCWNDIFADKLYQSLASSVDRIAVINKDSNPDEIDLAMRNLADGKIQIVISSGQGSFGQNIKKSTGNFPDLKVSVINPETEFQVSQAFRRNRLDDKTINDFAIFFEKNNLLLLSSFLSEKKQKKLSNLVAQREEIEKKYINSPELANLKSYLLGIDEEIRSLTVDALMASQHRNVQDEDNVISQDILFLKYIDPLIKQAKKETYSKEIKKDGHFEERIRKMINERFQGVGQLLLNQLAIELQAEVIDQISHTETSLYHEYLVDFSTFNINPNNKKFDRETSLMNLWEKRIKNKKESWEKDLKQKYFWETRIEPYLQERVADLELIIERIKRHSDSMKARGIDVDMIKTFLLVDLPFYPYEKESHELDIRNSTSHPHGQLSKESALGKTAVEGLMSRISTGKPTRLFITPPKVLQTAPGGVIQQFFLAKNNDAYLNLIRKLNPDIPFALGEEMANMPDSSTKNGAYLLPSEAEDTKGIVVFIEKSTTM